MNLSDLVQQSVAPKIQVRAPDGTIIQFPAGTPHAQINSVMGAYHDGVQRAQSNERVPGTLAVNNGMAFGHAADIDAAKAALATGAKNLVGLGPGYGMKDAFNATKAAEQKVLSDYAAKHPVLNTAANVIGSFANPLSLAGGEWVGAAKGLLPAMGRAALVGAGEGGIAGGLPGAVTGAVVGPLAPGAGAAAGQVAKVTKGVARNVQRIVGAANPADVATRKLAAAMAKDVKAGADPAAALANWPGNSRPSLVDVAGENVRAAVRDAGTQGPARTTLRNYRDQVAANLQGNAQALTRRLTPSDTRTVPQIGQAIDADIAAASAPAVNVAPGSGGAALSDALNERANAARQSVTQAYNAARAADPDQAHLPASYLPQVAADLHGAISDFAPSSIRDVRRVIGQLDTTSSPTARDLFELRSQLSNLRVGQPTPQTVAAGRAVSALDDHINNAVDNNLFTGDPSVVGLWQNANRARRAFGQQFEGNDLIHALTEQDYRGGGRNLAVAPEDASRLLFGSGSGVSARPNIERDFSRVTDLLGDDHPAVQAVRNEAASRLLAGDAGTPAYGSAYQAFQQQNPSAATALLPDLNLGDAQTQIANALARRQALQGGGRVLSLGPDNYVANVGPLGPNSPEAQVAARAALMDAIGAPQEGATAALNRIATAGNKGGTLGATFGDDAANAYRSGIGAEAQRDETADWLAPNLGSKTFSSGQDAKHGMFGGLHDIALGLVNRAVNGVPLNDAERQALVLPAIGDLSNDYLMSLLAKPKPTGMIGSQYAVAPLAITGGEAASR